jgi:hypothetical protein
MPREIRKIAARRDSPAEGKACGHSSVEDDGAAKEV